MPGRSKAVQDVNNHFLVKKNEINILFMDIMLFLQTANTFETPYSMQGNR